MIITILHLSDIHIKNSSDAIFNKLSALANSIKAESESSDHVVVLTTGDIAFSGKEDEYTHAKTLYTTLLDSIATDKTLLFAPGNHDCDHSNEEKKAVREELINVITKDHAKIPTFKNAILEPQFQFNQFVDALSECTGSNPFYQEFSLPSQEHSSIDFCLMNSSWMSEKKEAVGKIIPYGYDQISKSDAEIRICAMHHTPNWFHPEERRDFRDIIESESCFVLTGHEHEFYSTKSTDYKGNETIYIEGKVLQDSKNENISGYNIIHIDTENSRYRATTHSYSGDFYSKHYVVEDWTEIKPAETNKKIVVNSDYYEYICDPGVLYMHPRKKDLNLDDIYIHPDMRDLDAEKTATKGTCIPLVSSSVFFNGDTNKVIVLGEEKSGRTSLCKQYFKHKVDSGEIAILISGVDIKSHQIDTFKKLVNKEFKKQYSDKYIDIFEQTESHKIHIIIDDFNKSKLNHKHKSLLLVKIDAYYKNVLITADDLLRIEELVTEEIQDFSQKYNFYQIEQFGHLLRSKLISKWNELGQESYISDEDLTRLNDNAKNTIDTVIGKNYVPSFPFFLITILNSMDDTGKKSLAQSSYGYYYDYLITGALKKLSLKNEDIDALYNYLTELAHHLFDNETLSMTEMELSEFHSWYCKEYSLILNRTKYIEMLIRSNIIRNINEEYSFKYKYYYYYFLARYIAQHLSEKKSQKIVSEMCSSLHLDESSNVVMFLTHLSKNPFILDEVLKNSKAIFEKNKPTTLQKDVEIINKLVSKLPEIELKDFSVEQYREENYKIQDENDKNPMEMPPEIDEDDQAYDLLVSLQKAFKHQEIIGQILKNYYGSLKGAKKQELCSEAFELCLRALSDFYNLLNNNIAVIVDELKQIIKENGKVKEEKIDSIAKKELFHICEHISYCFIKKIATSIGSEKLEGTYRAIVEEDDTVANRMIEMSIKLDFFKGFPTKDVKKLCKELESNILPYAVLKKLVINYLYMFPTPFTTRQQICDAANISMNCQRAIEATTTQKKKP